MNSKIKFRLTCSPLLAAFLVAALTGCAGVKDKTATGNVWSTPSSYLSKAPTLDPEIALFQTRDGQEVLVEYKEDSGKIYEPTARSFLLYQNETKIASHTQPHFLSKMAANRLRGISIPIGSATNQSPPEETTLRALPGTNSASFTLVVDGVERGPYHLPTYRKHNMTIAEKVVLTPCTLTIDGVMLGAFAGIYWAAAGAPH